MCHHRFALEYEFTKEETDSDIETELSFLTKDTDVDVALLADNKSTY